MTSWPTAELHVHIEGTLEVELLVGLARRNGVRLPTYDPQVLRARYEFTDLQSFLDIYHANLAVLRRNRTSTTSRAPTCGARPARACAVPRSSSIRRRISATVCRSTR